MRIKKPKIVEIKTYTREMLIGQIREMYSVDDEFRILNKGIIDSQDTEYLEYRNIIDELVSNYQQQTGEIYERGNRD